MAKVKIPSQTVEVDLEKWAFEYGIDVSESREDIKLYFDGWFQEQIDRLGLRPEK